MTTKPMITSEDAVSIARVLAEESSAVLGYRLSATPRKISLDNHEWGHKILQIDGDFWAVIFDFDLPEGTQMHPDFVHIVVDPKTGNSGFLPLK
jgi:hypothetical protein